MSKQGLLGLSKGPEAMHIKILNGNATKVENGTTGYF